MRCMLQVPILKAHLKGKWIGGWEWRAGNKKRSELISDYRSACTPQPYLGDVDMLHRAHPSLHTQTYDLRPCRSRSNSQNQ